MDTNREHYKPSNKGLEREYRRKLDKAARHIGDLVNGFDPVTPEKLPQLRKMLHYYGETLRAWAELAARQMIHTANKKDEHWWRGLSANMHEGIRSALRSAPVAPVMEQMVREQVELISSLTDDAAERVGKLVIEGSTLGERADAIRAEILNTGQVTRSRAQLIARTEVARTSSKLTQARALSVGSNQYIWRTAQDRDVRWGHRLMSGKVIRWDTPPPVNEGTREKPHIMHHHAGEIWNCRCYPEPIIPE